MPFFAIFVPRPWQKIKLLIFTNLGMLGIDLYVFEDEKSNGKGSRTQKRSQMLFLPYQCHARATREPKFDVMYKIMVGVKSYVFEDGKSIGNGLRDQKCSHTDILGIFVMCWPPIYHAITEIR